MTYQMTYSSEATMPMQADDLEELLVQARRNNAAKGITGALVYAEGVFLQILEGDRVMVKELMARIERDLRHERVTVLREAEIAAPVFTAWGMAYLGATPEQVAEWAGLGAVAGNGRPSDGTKAETSRTARFAQDILALLMAEKESPSRA